MKKIILPTLIVTALAASTVAWARPGAPGPGAHRGGHERKGPEMHVARLLKDADLREAVGITDEQAAALEEIHYQAQKESVSLDADLELARIELRRMMEASGSDEVAVMQAVEQVGAARTALQKTRVSALLKSRSVLGEETAEKLRSEVRKRARQHMEKIRDHRQNRRGPGGPDLGEGHGGGPSFGPPDGPPFEAGFEEAGFEPFPFDPES